MNAMHRFMWWIPFAVVITGFCGLTEVVVQQNYRQSANDPQIQMSEDIALALSNGAKVTSVVPSQTVDIAFSLSPFVMVYDTDRKLVSSNAKLNGENVTIPDGTLVYTTAAGRDAVTWQPMRGVRSALVITKYSNGFVAVGRSLREVEKREDSLTKTVALVWALATGVTFALFAVSPMKKGKH